LNLLKAIGLDGAEGKTVKVDDRFRIGSITKLCTATLIHQLVEEGLLKTKDFYFNLINEDSKKFMSGLHLYNRVYHSSAISLHHF
jgi:hypothetical protein